VRFFSERPQALFCFSKGVEQGEFGRLAEDAAAQGLAITRGQGAEMQALFLAAGGIAVRRAVVKGYVYSRASFQ
jgi:hypothetical protein